MGIFDVFRRRRDLGPTAAGRSGRPASQPHPGFRLVEADGTSSLTLDLGELPTDGVVEKAGEEPNGAFWEGVAHYAAPELVSRLELDSEGSMFAAYGAPADLGALRDRLLPLVHEPGSMAALLDRAARDGVTLEGHGR
ncbi:Imm51 family immunity protein [Ornithinimicrobium cerasi]|uniref:Imm51 family immunity protein n=1 Tax=Ornithinimicrobium cerasi TaxID=2248773 RepID=UPI000F0075DE|nr:Imm51 family immunity protein [Ornithinimicrobium cerasi]